VPHGAPILNQVAIMISLDTHASTLRSRLVTLFGFASPYPPIPVEGLNRETVTTLKTLRKKCRRDGALFQQGLALHRQDRSLAQLNAMFDAVTHYSWDVWAGPIDVSSFEERREREKILIALLMRECRPALDQHPILLDYILGEDA
jgi:hypothetical protein